MRTGRLEAFSDGVLAVIITIMVLELHPPDKPTFHALTNSARGLLTYVLSFLYIAIYWNNHHHLFQLVGRIRGGVLWANLHLLFWLSLIPFSTAWMDGTRFAKLPVGAYGTDLLLCAIAWYVLQLTIFRAEGKDSPLRHAVGRDVKGKAAPVLYVVGIVLATVAPWISMTFYTAVALWWLVPDRRLERAVMAAEDATSGGDTTSD